MNAAENLPKEYREGYETFMRWAGNSQKLAQVENGPYPEGSDAAKDWKAGFQTAATNEAWNVSMNGPYVNITETDTTDAEGGMSLRRVPAKRISELRFPSPVCLYLIDFAKQEGFNHVELSFDCITVRIERWTEEGPEPPRQFPPPPVYRKPVPTKKF